MARHTLHLLLSVFSRLFMTLGLMLTLSMSLHVGAVTVAAASSLAKPAAASVRAPLQVGKQHAIKTIAGAARLAKDGDTVEVDAGDYIADVAVWTQKNLTLRAVGGRVKLVSFGAIAEGKGIWVVRAEGFTVEGFDFTGATTAEHNAAGIRFEKGSMTVRDCHFFNNENGILTSNSPELVLRIEGSEFAHNGHGDGRSHNLYVGAIAQLWVSGSYFHHARGGHLLKSRAAVNHIFYNRLTDELGGHASYELEFPTGGIAYVVGNIIEQGSQTENPHMISFGAEGYVGPRHGLYLVNNTLVDDRPSGGIFLRVKPGTVALKVINNLLVGTDRIELAGAGDFKSNYSVDWGEFEMAVRGDYRLKPTSRLRGAAVSSGQVNGLNLMPEREYSHPRKSVALAMAARHPGALQSSK